MQQQEPSDLQQHNDIKTNLFQPDPERRRAANQFEAINDFNAGRNDRDLLS